MKWCFFILSLMISHTSYAAIGDIAGKWVYYKKIFQGVEMPQVPEDPIHLHFDFTADGTSRLYWWNDSAEDHCERKGVYRIEENFLVDRVVWVNPKNSIGCSADPDMQLGKETKTPFFLRDGDLYLEFHLGNDPLFYVWRKQGG